MTYRKISQCIAAVFAGIFCY